MIIAASAFQEMLPIGVFAVTVFVLWAILSAVSQRNSRAQERLARLSRPASLAELEDPAKQSRQERFQGVMEAAKAMSSPLMPKTELEQNQLKVTLANAGFRSDSASSVYLGIRFVTFLLFFVVAVAIYVPTYGFSRDTMVALAIRVGFVTGLGFYLPSVVLWWLKRKRQQEIFLTLPDALDLMVVCVESGLGLDAAMRKVCEEMKSHAKVIAEELSLANFQLQMGRPRREVLHDLGVRTGVDDVKALAAILIQADRFGSSIAQCFGCSRIPCGFDGVSWRKRRRPRQRSS